MTTKIKMNPILQLFTNNQDTIEVRGSTIGECLDDLVRQFPELKNRLFDPNGILLILIGINGEIVRQQDLNHPVADEDELQLFPMVAGG